MTHQPMQELPKGARFIGPDGRTEYLVKVPASEHPSGFVEVWDLSMGDAEVLRRLNDRRYCEEGTHPREGFFAFTHPTDVEVLS